ncbi:MAG: GDP-mannose 4,6-dehydratase [Candidatus Andersenbacteria bacterium]
MGPIVITGGSGFVGRHLIVELQKHWPETKIFVWDRTPPLTLAGVSFYPIDITDPETYIPLLVEQSPQWIVHLAAIASVPYATEHPEQAQAVNVQGTLHLLEAIRSTSPDTRMLAVSSADIYGRGSDTPLPELPLSQATPQNVYAQSKWEAEKIIEDQFNDQVIRVRPFPHIGPGQAKGFVTADFASQVAAIEREQQSPIISVGNLESWRDFTDVRDTVRAYRLLMERGTEGQVYHVASGTGVKIQYILDKLLHLSTATIEVQIDPARQRPSDTPVIIGDATKLRTQTNWSPTISLDRSLEDILAWWREQGLKSV